MNNSYPSMKGSYSSMNDSCSSMNGSCSSREIRPAGTSKKCNFLVYCLIGLNILIFLLTDLFGDPSDTVYMIRRGAMYHPLTLGGEAWRLFTAMFLHFDIAHLLSNMLSLYAVGNIIEKAFGKVRFLIIYLGSGLGAGLVSTLFHAWKDDAAVCAGASGAIFGLAGALICLALFRKTEAYGVDSKRVLPAILVTAIVSSTGSTDTAAHIGGLITGFLLSLLLFLASVIHHKYRGKSDSVSGSVFHP